MFPKKSQTLGGIGAKWSASNKAPICFFGDSTTDGRVTTSDGTNNLAESNYNYASVLSGGVVPDGEDYDHDESEVPYCYVSVLQRMARDFYGNTTLRCYNAGFAGKELYNGWASANVYNAVYGNPSYSDCEMLALNFGINDSEDVSGENLRLRTYEYTKAIAIHALMKGVQPFIVTTNAFCGLHDSGSDYAENFEVVSIVDAVKRQVADELNLELVEMGQFMYEFLAKNNEAYTTANTISDDIHGGDLIHLKQAEFLFYKYLSGGLVIDASKGLKVDATNPAMNFPYSVDLLNSSDFGSQYPRRFVSFPNTITVDDVNVFDLWLWCDKPNLGLVYSTPVGRYDTPSDATALPQLKLLANQNSSTVQSFETYNDVTPSYNCGVVPSVSYDGVPLDFVIGKLRYGINRVQIYLPDGFVDDLSNWTTGVFRFGFFSVFDCTEKLGRNATLTGLSSTFDNGNKWVECLDAPIVMDGHDSGQSAGTSAAYNMTYTNYMPNYKNLYSLNKVGDSVDISFKYDDTSTYCGYVLSSVKDIDTNGFDSDYDISYLMSFVLYDDGTSVKYVFVGSSYLNAVTTSVAYSDVAGKQITIRFELVTSDAITMSIYDNAGTLLGSSVLDSEYSRLMLSGRVGGGYINYQNNNTASLTINSMKLRVNQ